MHTIMVIGAGLALLAIITLKAKLDSTRAFKSFWPLWLACSIGNMVYGVMEAGYSWADEAPILLVVFGVPALIAWLIARLRQPA